MLFYPGFIRKEVPLRDCLSFPCSRANGLSSWPFPFNSSNVVFRLHQELRKWKQKCSIHISMARSGLTIPQRFTTAILKVIRLSVATNLCWVNAVSSWRVLLSLGVSATPTWSYTVRMFNFWTRYSFLFPAVDICMVNVCYVCEMWILFGVNKPKLKGLK
jgi:hypothetical protein